MHLLIGMIHASFPFVPEHLEFVHEQDIASLTLLPLLSQLQDAFLLILSLEFSYFG